MAPYTGKAKSYHTIQFPYATSSRSSLVQGTAIKKSHINNQTTSKIWHSTTSHKNNNLSGLLQAIKPLTQV